MDESISFKCRGGKSLLSLLLQLEILQFCTGEEHDTHAVLGKTK